MQEDVERLCARYTTLSEDDICYIKKLADILQFLADTEQADAFINCAYSGGESVVVAQAQPFGGPSAYRSSVVGMHSKPVNEPAVARTFMVGSTTKRMKATNQERTPVVQTARPIRYREKLVGVLTYEQLLGQDDGVSSMDELPLEKKEKMESECVIPGIQDWRWLAESMEESLLMVDKSGVVVYRNAAAQQLYSNLGYMEDVLGQEYENVCLRSLQSSDECNGMEISIGKYYLHMRNVKIPLNGIKMAIFINDVTHIKNQERELVLKSVAIQEIHHRIKNNLQTVGALLRLQLRRTESEVARTALLEANSRIQAIAATHQILAQHGVEHVMIQEVIVAIRDSALDTYSTAQMNATVSIEGDDFAVNSDIATTVATVINELIQNSLEHGFKEKNEGIIQIVVTEKPLYAAISISDNGSGFDSGETQHLGLNIVRSLIQEKLKGTLEIVSGLEGTCVSFDFPI